MSWYPCPRGSRDCSRCMGRSSAKRRSIPLLLLLAFDEVLIAVVLMMASGCSLTHCRPELMRPKTAIPLDSQTALSSLIEMVPGVNCQME